MKITLRASLILIVLSVMGGPLLAPSVARAQGAPMPGMPGMGDKKPPSSTPSPLPNLSQDRTGWPSPVDDDMKRSFMLVDLLEFQRTRNGPNAARWDFVGWRGGDYHRLWFKTEGRQNLSGKGEGFDAQLLYGK